LRRLRSDAERRSRHCRAAVISRLPRAGHRQGERSCALRKARFRERRCSPDAAPLRMGDWLSLGILIKDEGCGRSTCYLLADTGSSSRGAGLHVAVPPYRPEESGNGKERCQGEEFQHENVPSRGALSLKEVSCHPFLSFEATARLRAWRQSLALFRRRSLGAARRAD
jgi:hypothetical protein